MKRSRDDEDDDALPSEKLQKRHRVLIKLVRQLPPQGVSQVKALVNSWGKRAIQDLNEREANKVYKLIQNMHLSFSMLPNEILERMIDEDNWDNVAKLCNTDKGMASWCRENHIWSYLLHRKFGMTIPEGVNERAYAAAAALVRTALTQRNRLFFIDGIDGPDGEELRVYLGYLNTSYVDREVGNIRAMGSYRIYEQLRQIVDKYFDANSYIHNLDFVPGYKVEGVFANVIGYSDEDNVTYDRGVVLEKDLIKLFYHLWLDAGYRWPTPIPTNNLNIFHTDDGRSYRILDDGQRQYEVYNPAP